jgi:hypothetical protein
VLEYTEKEGKKTPEVAVKIASQEWYGETQTS